MIPDSKPDPMIREVDLFRTAHTQMVQIPSDFELPGNKVTIRRDGDQLIIQPARSKCLAHVLADLQPLGPEDQFPDIDTTMMPAEAIDL